jgi:hypothetical protein
VDDDAAVRSALEGLQALPPRKEGWDAGPHRQLDSTGAPTAIAAFLATLLAAITVVVLAVTVSDRDAAAGVCLPIAYRFAGDPPDEVRTAFAAATAEISRRTGLRFAPAADGAARLSIAWMSKMRAETAPASGASGDSTIVGTGLGRWHREGPYRVLDGAAIELNARWQWSALRPQGENLRAVLIHELGHVVGLRHSSDERSYMFARTRSTPQQWTSEERRQLAAIGDSAGCQRAG